MPQYSVYKVYITLKAGIHQGGRQADLHLPVIVGRRGASPGPRCEFQKSWHWPGVVRRADARTTPGQQKS